MNDGCEFSKLDDPDLQGFFPQKTLTSDRDRLPLEWDILPPGYFWKSEDFPFPMDKQIDRKRFLARSHPRSPKRKNKRPKKPKPNPILYVPLKDAHRSINIVDYRSTLDPYWYLTAKYVNENQSKLRSIILDFLYRAICQGKSNKEIFALMESKAMPSINEDQLNVMRTEFKEKELKHPEKMALFRKRLGC